MNTQNAQPQVFNFDDNANLSLRTVMIEGEPWFVAQDITQAVGIAQVSKSLEGLDADEKGVHTMPTLGGNQRVAIISEAGMYTLLLRSRKPQAKPFRRWVTHEVLPSIRKHGGYLTPTKVEEALLNPDILIQLAENLKQEQEARLKAERERRWISAGREATLFSKTGVQQRHINKLEKENELLLTANDMLGNSNAQLEEENERLKEQVKSGDFTLHPDYSTVRSHYPEIAKYLDFGNHGSKTKVGQELTRISKEKVYKIKSVPDERYGSVNAYHKAVWKVFFKKLSKDPYYLVSYRY